jgi:GDP-6-deoxy-D-talose 4-dehydrogenase
MKVFVTGANGFTGSYLCSYLIKQGHEVIKSHANINDLTALIEEVSYAQPNYVVHLAGIAFMGHSDQEAMYRVHVFGTLNLLQALQLAKCTPKKILIASSAAVYGDSQLSIVDEKVCPHPRSHYATSKLAMEHMVQTWFDAFPIIITRPFNYTGVGQSNLFLIPKIVSHFKAKKETIELGNTDIVRDFSDVRDIVNIYWQLLQSSVTNCIINVCSGKGLSLIQILHDMYELAGYEINVQQRSDLMRKNEVHNLIGDDSLLMSIINGINRRDFGNTLSWMFNE